MENYFPYVDTYCMFEKTLYVYASLFSIYIWFTTAAAIERVLVYCANFTPAGYSVYTIIRCIHLFAFYVVYILMNGIVIGKLVRYRRRFVDNDSLIDHIRLILAKHKDFFVPYLIQAISLLPNLILDFVLTCPTADTLFIAYAHLISYSVQILAVAITFYLYVGLSPVYLAIFWDSSPVGRCLIYMKDRLKAICQTRVFHNSILLETYE